MKISFKQLVRIKSGILRKGHKVLLISFVNLNLGIVQSLSPDKTCANFPQKYLSSLNNQFNVTISERKKQHTQGTNPEVTVQNVALFNFMSDP